MIATLLRTLFRTSDKLPADHGFAVAIHIYLTYLSNYLKFCGLLLFLFFFIWMIYDIEYTKIVLFHDLSYIAPWVIALVVVICGANVVALSPGIVAFLHPIERHLRYSYSRRRILTRALC